MAHTFDTSAQIAAGTSNPQAVNYTCGAGATLLVVTLIYANGTRTGAPTYNSVALTQADQVRKHTSSPEACAEIWYMLGPPTGSSLSLSVPNPNTLALEVCISSYKAAAGFSSMLEKATGGNGAAKDPSVSITTAINGDVIVAVVASGADSWAPTARGGTQLYDTDNGTWGGGHQYFLQATAGAKAMSWSFNTSDDYGLCVAAFSQVRTGIVVSKADVFAVLRPPKGVNVSKAVAFAALKTPYPGLNVSKAVVFAAIYATAEEGGARNFFPFLLRYFGSGAGR